jgi:hypothetical protein
MNTVVITFSDGRSLSWEIRSDAEMVAIYTACEMTLGRAIIGSEQNV